MSTDNNDTPAPAETTPDMSNQLVLNNLSQDPHEMASVLTGLYMPKFLAGVDRLSSNALRRVLKKLVSYPLNDKEYKPTSQLESDVFNVGERLTEAKFMFMTAHYTQLIEQELKKELEEKETK